MKLSIKIFLLISILITSLLSQDDLKSKDIYIDYLSYPKRVFTKQKFEVVLKATILIDQSKYDKIITTFEGEENIDLPEVMPVWNKDKDNVFISNIIFKSKEKQFTLPNVTIALLKENNIVDFISLKSPKIKFEKIAVNQKLFSHVIASNLEINTVKTKQYTNSMLLSTINIEATNSNLEDIRLNEFDDQGIKSLSDSPPHQNIYYYVMIPSHTKEIRFTYYNTILKDFIMITLPITLDEELVSTQTDLNPYNSSILIYKQFAVILLLIIILILFVVTKKTKYLFMMVILISIIGYLFMPNKKIILQSDTKIYILPTKHSTVYKVLENKELVEIINKKDKYIKVLFKNKNIGWIKDDS
ncbi:MAG: hypothetical protein U9R39_01995 [Campylobacterota bacterium]|nr:hypothetical protein [Campylobacterota bacterium]